MGHQLSGQESFVFNDRTLSFTILDYWKFHYSNIFDLQDTIAEFIVAKALGFDKSQNDQYWTLYDLKYRNKKVEIKETSYYHSFNTEGKISHRRAFDIHKTVGYDPNPDDKEPRRQSDLYVFCLNTGYTAEDSYPLNLNNWEFFVVPTEVINTNCNDNKTISLGRIKSMGFQSIAYGDLKSSIDRIIDEMI